MRWVEIAVEAVDVSADAVTDILMDEGCGGTVARRPAGSAPADAVDVAGYLPVDDRLEARLENIRARVRRLPDYGLRVRSGEISVTWVNDEEWATAWRKFFKPLRFGRVVIKPSWEDFEAQQGDLIVEIDPGMAFGTGNHATTKLCLLVLQDYIRGGETFLDVGTGSGILAIAAAKLGAARIVGIDIDPVAVEAARNNVARSGMEDVLRIEEAGSPLAFEGTADVVVANIIPNVIIAMAEELNAKVAPGGVLITSGIIVERAEDVRSKLEALGLRTLEQREEGEWVVIVSRRAEQADG